MQRFKDSEIDKNILPLIKAMNGTGWIRTVSSCEGHLGAERFQRPYIAFYCKASKMKTLCRILNATSDAFDDDDDSVWLELEIVWNGEIHGCQEETPRGWIALNLTIETETTKKKKAFDLLSNGFKNNSVEA